MWSPSCVYQNHCTYIEIVHQHIHPKLTLNVVYKSSHSQKKKQLSRCHVDQTLHLSSSRTSVSYVETHVWPRPIPRTENTTVVWYNVQLLIEDQTWIHSINACWMRVMYVMMSGDIKCVSGWKVQSTTCMQPTGNITKSVCYYSAALETSNIPGSVNEAFTCVVNYLTEDRSRI